MTAVVIAVLVVLFCFSFVVLFGAPYVPTLTKQMNTALDMLDLAPGETMLELGCGDGKVLIAAAEKGWNVVGYELNPLLAAFAYLRTRRYGKRVKVVCKDFWRTKWPEAQGIYGFILPKYMPKLHTKLMQDYRKPVKVVSFAFAIPDRSPKQVKDGVYLYIYNRTLARK